MSSFSGPDPFGTSTSPDLFLFDSERLLSPKIGLQVTLGSVREIVPELEECYVSYPTGPWVDVRPSSPTTSKSVLRHPGIHFRRDNPQLPSPDDTLILGPRGESPHSLLCRLDDRFKYDLGGVRLRIATT